ncbi:MAG: DNA polymerase III subunit gamma/tau [bacterium]
MSYIVLARRYRPQNFDELVGQNHVALTLKNALASNRIAHAYLFSGPRGIGKTSAARILAKALNCRERKDFSPCNICVSCEEITKGISMDVVEIDGASNRGIDEIRSLRENVKFAPVSGKYRIYIIDEVHMLTKEAFNALLKTLEEPPPHVIFIFATTEPYKIPLTILSRCQRFDFRRVSVSEIVKHLKYVADKENIDADEEAFYLIAQASEGSMRDSQSLLDQAVSYSGAMYRAPDKVGDLVHGGGKISKKDMQDFLGIAEENILANFCEIVIKRDSSGALYFLHNLLEKGCDLNQFIKTILDYLRHILVTIIVPGSDIDVLADLSPSQIKNISKYRDAFTKDRLLEVMKILNETELEIRRSSYPRILMEMALVKITQGEVVASRQSPVTCRGEAVPLPDVGAIHESPKTNDGTSPDLSTEASAKAEASAKGDERRHACRQAGATSDKFRSHWREIVRLVKEKKVVLGSFLEHCEIVEEKDNEFSLGFYPDSKFYKERVEENNNLKFISLIVKELTGNNVQIKCVIREGVEHCHSEQSEESKYKISPFGRNDDNSTDSFIKSALDTFGGEIVEIKKPKHKT